MGSMPLDRAFSSVTAVVATTDAPPPPSQIDAASTRARLVGFGLLTITALGWGINWPITKLLLTQCPPLTARGISGLLASIALVTLARVRGDGLVVRQEAWGPLVRASLLNVTAWMGLTTVSLLWLSAGQAATLAYTMPAWAALLAWPLLHERLTLAKVIALVLSVGGVVLLVNGGAVTLAWAELPGVSLAVSAAVLFALGAVLSKRQPLGLSPVPLTAWQVGIGAVPLLGLGLFLERPDVSAMSWLAWAAIAYTAVASLGVCYLSWFAALRRLPASTAAVGTLLTPVIGVAASCLMFNEPLVLREVLALGLVSCGILLSARNTAPTARDRRERTS